MLSLRNKNKTNYETEMYRNNDVLRRNSTKKLTSGTMQSSWQYVVVKGKYCVARKENFIERSMILEKEI